jgi:hypothetical protein
MMVVQWMLVSFTLWVAGGATCYRQTVKANPFPPPPQVFSGLPTVSELATVMNRTDCDHAACPAIRCRSKFRACRTCRDCQQPWRSSDLGGFACVPACRCLLGSGIDIGSNDESSGSKSLKR